ncbi:ankyrin repeat domain-containing protein 13A isoform X2 [Salmo salar]|uniref:Ankyrin repeat domain-containing protein 13A isoform X2 n=1 Tax=Salmo salar TaxID=8030 RepID=A0A1S3NLF3_SALSA|nr:ankyrin repeat domain-containing protein 13A isoform X2 [Salmo salar]|eukprot:XP_014016239.1 PREDICTED: ankyrin repeat domain-containing protein 13A isoform X2 [Salmo salar]
MLSAANEDFRVKFPLHSLVWENDYRKLENDSTKNDVEAVDPRGRTPLHLAVSLGHLESARVLLRHGAEVTKENAKNWTVLQEAVSTGDPEMVQLVLQRRDYLKASTALGGVPELLSKIRESPDFYMEMKWEFTSWIPLVSRVCPSDVCRIWKSGASLRVDATLLGFENMTWIRGRRSYIFRGDDACTELMEVNHDEQVVDTERFDISREIEDVTLDSMQPAEQEVAKRLTTPIVNTFLDTRDIAFERNKSGIWGWRSDKTEVVNGFEAKVFTVNNVNVVIRTRTEHLTDEEKARIKSERNVLESLLGTVEQQISAQGDLTLEYATANNPTAITPEEYFDPAFDLEDRDIGRPIELTIRTQKFKGTLWMSEEHPLSLVEQVTPIIDLMARTSTHFARLRDFVTLKFPPGFPVKIEIPLFHVLNARISFGSVNKCSTGEPLETPPSAATPEVEQVREEGGCDEASVPPLFQVCPSVFEVPSHYRHRGVGGSRHTPVSNHDEELLQYAIHQSLLESGGGALGQEVTWGDANGDLTDPILSSQSDGSIPEGVLVDLGDTTSSQASSGTSASSPDTDLRMAMELSAQAQAEEERRRKEEEEELERILQLSLTEK